MSTDTSNLHLDLLDEQRKKLLQALLPYTQKHVLAGGTALALQLNHRKSFDFDFFSTHEIPKELLRKLSQTIKVEKVINDSGDELTFFTKDNIKVTFLFYYFPKLFDLLTFNNLPKMYTVKEIAVHKAHTISRRGEYRDYFDLYAILHGKHIKLVELIESATKAFGNIFDSKLFLEQLVYFDDLLNVEIIPVEDQQIPSKEEIKKYFEELVSAYVGK